MNDRHVGNTLTNVAVAVFAGALGSVLTLAATHRFAVTDRPVAATERAAPSTGQTQAVRSLGSSATVDTNTAQDNTSAVTDATATEIKHALSAAAEERAQLADALLTLTRQFDELEANVVNLNALSTMQTEPVDAQLGSEAMPGDAVGFRRSGDDDGTEQQYENLLAAGLDEQSARDLQARRDQYQLARLELFDQAAREGWADSGALDERLEALDATRVDLREELGDTAYDRYLFESGRPNRVGVASVISGSAAEQAGLRNGDLVTSYAGQRIFRVQELQEASRAGSRGEYVQVVFERAGQSMSTDIPRGPLGVTLTTSRVNP